jgi:RNA polymerase sigma-70 factor, ECF subfamily
MGEPDQEKPVEAEIRRHIKKRDFEGALETALREFRKEINTRVTNSLRDYVDDPEDEAEALTQIIFTKFYSTLPRYDPSITRARTWLHRITTKCIAERRRHGRRQTIYYQLITHEMNRREPYWPNPQDRVLKQSMLELVKSVINNNKKLSNIERQVLILFYFEEKSVAEIADDLVRSGDNIRQRLSTGRDKIRDDPMIRKEIDGDR